MAATRPSWQLDDCPAWCVGGHLERDLPDDRVHVGEAPSIPVIARSVHVDEHGVLHEAVDAIELDLGIHRRDGTRQTWIYLGDGTEHGIEVSAESFDRVLAALDRASQRWATAR